MQRKDKRSAGYFAKRSKPDTSQTTVTEDTAGAAAPSGCVEPDSFFVGSAPCVSGSHNETEQYEHYLMMQTSQTIIQDTKNI